MARVALGRRAVERVDARLAQPRRRRAVEPQRAPAAQREVLAAITTRWYTIPHYSTAQYITRQRRWKDERYAPRGHPSRVIIGQPQVVVSSAVSDAECHHRRSKMMIEFGDAKQERRRTNARAGVPWRRVEEEKGVTTSSSTSSIIVICEKMRTRWPLAWSRASIRSSSASLPVVAEEEGPMMMMMMMMMMLMMMGMDGDGWMAVCAPRD